jgi:hypothetical protein
MRNLLAFLAAATIAFIGLGWYLDWYTIRSQPGPSGHRSVNIDLDSVKITNDVQKGVRRGEEKLQQALDKKAAQRSDSGAPADASTTMTIRPQQ